MTRRGRVKTEYGPEALYSYTLVDALLDIKSADRDPTNPGAYHSAVNHFLSLAAADIGYFTPAWAEWQRRHLRRPDGTELLPGDRLTKLHRRIEVSRAVWILRKRGILGFRDKPFSDDADLIAELLDVEQELVEASPITEE